MNQFEQLRRSMDALRIYASYASVGSVESAAGRAAINELEALLADMIKSQAATGETLVSATEAITAFTATLRNMLAIVLKCAAMSKDRGQEIAELESRLLELTNALN